MARRTPVRDILAEAERQARSVGQHKLWREVYERARGRGADARDAVSTANQAVIWRRT